MLWNDIRYSLRMLGRNPGFSLVAIIVLSVGIGITVAMFSLVNAVLFRPLPVKSPDQLMFVYGHVTRPNEVGTTISLADYEYIRSHNDVFADVAGVSTDYAKLALRGEAVALSGQQVTTNYFDVLGISPAIGRAFLPEEGSPSTTPVVVISYGLWKSQFNQDPSIIGQTITLLVNGGFSGFYQKAGRPYTVVGVMPEGFRGTISPWESADYWVSKVQRAQDYDYWPYREDTPLTVSHLLSRLKPGINHEAARQAVALLTQQLRPAEPWAKDWELFAQDSVRIRLPFDPRGRLVPERLAAALMATCAVVLLIGTTNLAGMLMARAVSRRTEIAIRLSLGAGKWRLARQLLVESLLLSVGGGAFGIVVSGILTSVFALGTPAEVGYTFQSFRFSLDLTLDSRVALITIIATVSAGLLMGIVPALQALRIDLSNTVGGGGFTTPRHSRSRLRHWIVTPQVCFSMMLLLVGGVLVRSELGAELVDRGYEPGGLISISYQLPTGKSEAEQMAAGKARKDIDQRIIERLRSIPGITGASMTSATVSGIQPMHSWIVAQDEYPRAQHYWVSSSNPSPGYFQTLRVPILLGRDFNEHDAQENSPQVAIVSQKLARMLWPDKEPIGRYVGMSEPDSPHPPHWVEVVGVAPDLRPTLSEGDYNPAIYFSQQTGFNIVVRSERSIAEMDRVLKQAITDVEPTALVAEVTTMTGAMAEVLYSRRMAAAILALAGIAGMLLASVGLYGVMSYSTAQREREIGIRAALGAGRTDIVRLVVGEGGRVAAVGCAIGLAFAYAAIRIVSSKVIALPGLDWLTLIVVPLLIGSVILLACYLPARRAAKDPMNVLRGL